MLPLMTGLLATAFVGSPAQAQPPVPTQAQSQVNPFPSAHGNAQNRGRAGDDKYWGITDDNFLWNQTPMARIPVQGGNELVGFSGWTFPFPVNQTDGRLIKTYGDPVTKYTNPGITLDDVVPPLTLPVVGTTGPGLTPVLITIPPIPGATRAGGQWAIGQTGPSANATDTSVPPLATGPTYSRIAAVARPNTTSVDYVNNNPNATFSWYPNIPGVAGVVQRYAIRVVLPTIVDDTGAETRITDARYTVFYAFRDRAGGIQYRNKVCFVSQASDGASGGKYLSDTPGGTPAYFPFFSEASYGTTGGPIRRAEVVLDNTTADNPANDPSGNGTLYVLADALQFEQRVSVVSAAPTLTPIHGGRKVRDSATTVAGQRQPGTGPNYQIGDNGTVTPINTGGGVIMPNSAYGAVDPVTGLGGFIGDPRDNDYTDNPNDFSVMYMAPEAYARYKVLPDEYNGTYPYTGGIGNYPVIQQPGAPLDIYGTGLPLVQPITPVPPTVLPLDPNESIGTRLQVDPRAALAGPALPAIPIQRVSANNFQSYRTNANAAPDYDLLDPATANKPVPLYSQVQVILARTVYVPDPEVGVSNNNLDGTKTIAVGEVVALDWQTGATIWRFPDRTYLPQTRPGLELRQPFNNSLVPGAGFRNPIIGYEQRPIYAGNTITSYTDVLQRPINQVPGINGYDLNGNGVIDDDEIFIAPQGDNASGGLSGSVTIAGQIPVQGDVQIPVYDQVNVALPPFDRNAGANLQGFSTNIIPDNRIIGTIVAPPGRYKKKSDGSATLATVAYVASNNGVIYAFDPYGNNDNAYTEQILDATNNPQGPRRLGNFRAGTTNALWTFNANSLPQLRSGSLERPYLLPRTKARFSTIRVCSARCRKRLASALPRPSSPIARMRTTRRSIV